MRRAIGETGMKSTMTVSGHGEASAGLTGERGASSGTAPFSRFEWMIAGRYLRARRKEGFISVIAGFSFLGIMLGVATLIIVMAVMNGFRHDLFSKIMGLNGHVIVQKLGDPFTDYTDISKEISKVPGVIIAMPVIEGQVMRLLQRAGPRRPRTRRQRERSEIAEARLWQRPRRHARWLRSADTALRWACALPTSCASASAIR